MKILFPIGSFYPAQSGGPNNTIYWHAKTLKKNGIKPIIITTNHDLKKGLIPFNRWLETDYGRVIYTTKKIHYFPIRLIIASLKHIRKVEIIHLTAVFYPPSWILAFFAIFFGKKVVWSVRGELKHNALLFSKNRKKIFLKIIYLISRSKLIYFHATSTVEKLSIHRVLGTRIKCIEIPNLILLPNRIFYNPKENFFLFIGRIHPIKAIDNLLEALSKSIKFLASDFHLKIAGDANNKYGLALKKLVKDLKIEHKIQFIGHVKGMQKQALYANAYFSFMPSHTENFGNVVVEALAQGTPVVASKGTPWQILEKYEAGYWVDNSITGLVHIIDEILSLSETRYEELRKNSYKLVVNKFDVEQNISHWIEIYEKILNE